MLWHEFKDYYGRELGYVLSKDYWGKGLMPEAVNAVKDYLFGELDYDFLICGYYDFNEQSKRVQTKCGFKPLSFIGHDNANGRQKNKVHWCCCWIPRRILN